MTGPIVGKVFGVKLSKTKELGSGDMLVPFCINRNEGKRLTHRISIESKMPYSSSNILTFAFLGGATARDNKIHNTRFHFCNFCIIYYVFSLH